MRTEVMSTMRSWWWSRSSAMCHLKGPADVTHRNAFRATIAAAGQAAGKKQTTVRAAPCVCSPCLSVARAPAATPGVRALVVLAVHGPQRHGLG
jgi:hypothetical protein